MWDDRRCKWTVTVRDSTTDEVIQDEADFVVFATGLLSNPLWPSNIPGREKFRGRMVHSGDWKAAGIEDQPGFTWTDKRVGVIGVVRSGIVSGQCRGVLTGQGASGVQIVPALQKQAKQVLNFGRSKRE